MEYPLGANQSSVLASPPRVGSNPERAAPNLNCGFSKASTRHRWRFFSARKALRVVDFRRESKVIDPDSQKGVWERATASEKVLAVFVISLLILSVAFVGCSIVYVSSMQF